MSTLGGMWRRLWRGIKPASEWEDPAAEGLWPRAILRLSILFAVLFAGVFFAFWWAGSAVRFSAARAADRVVPTWNISGVVLDATTHQPIPWARVEDDPAGQPPFFGTDADVRGIFSLATLAESHRVRCSAPGYTPRLLAIGRAWFLWLPRGAEYLKIDLTPLPS
ncbi:MAG: hypothetical protein ABI759_02430 [Candidatus Solibacter sp.]